jgi:hypothetical protein
MQIQYDFNRKTLDNFLKAIHPINKRSRGNFSLSSKRAESPFRMISPIFDYSLANSSPDSPRSELKAPREMSPVKLRVPQQRLLPVQPQWNLMNLQGFPVSLKKRSKTPSRFDEKMKKIVTKLPFVRWAK